MATTKSEDSANPVRWGILGAARIAAFKTIPAMVASPWCQPQAVGARDRGRAQALAQRFGIPAAYGSYEEVLGDPAVEAVYIALPNHLHVKWTLAALQKGKHVLCEKPMAMTAKEAAALAPVPDTLKVAEAFMVRQHPRWARLREVLRSERYGKPLAVHMLLSFSLDNPDDFRNQPAFGGGAMYDLGCYSVMSARYIFESEPRRVIATAEHNASGADTTTTAILDFGSGRHASFTVSVAMAPAQALQIVCERGLIDLPKPYQPASDKPSALHVDITSKQDLAQVAETVTTVFSARDQYEDEVTAFARAVRGHPTTFFGVHDSIANMRSLDAVFASLKSGRWEDVHS